MVTVLVEGVSVSDLTENTQETEPSEESDEGLDNETNWEDESRELPSQTEAESGELELGTTGDHKREKKLGRPKWLAKVLPRTCGLMQFKLEVLAPSTYEMKPIDELVNIPLSVTWSAKLCKGN